VFVEPASFTDRNLGFNVVPGSLRCFIERNHPNDSDLAYDVSKVTYTRKNEPYAVDEGGRLVTVHSRNFHS